MSKQFSGIISVSRSDTLAGAKTTIAGKIGSGSSLDPENIKTETTTGQAFGGGQLTGELHFLSHADYATLLADMKADVEKHYHFHYKDGRILSTKDPIGTVFVRIGTTPDARTGITPMILDFEQVGDDVMLEDTTPA